eukprot:236098-Alexandrium_andersonii.AAC.1
MEQACGIRPSHSRHSADAHGQPSANVRQNACHPKARSKACAMRRSPEVLNWDMCHRIQQVRL